MPLCDWRRVANLPYFDDAVGDFWETGEDRCVVAGDDVFGVGDEGLHALEGADEGCVVEGAAIGGGHHMVEAIIDPEIVRGEKDF